MVKTYKYNKLYIAALYLIFIVSIYGAYDIGKTYGFIFGFILFISFGWLVSRSA